MSQGAAIAVCACAAGCAREDGGSIWLGVASAQGRPDASIDAGAVLDAATTHLRRPASSIDASVHSLDGAIEQPPAVASSEHPLRNLLGRRIAEIEADAGAPLDGGTAWRPFRGDVFVQFHGDRVNRITAHVPIGTACAEAARRFGFDHAMPPLRRASTCEWPAQSGHHVIEAGLGARLDLRTGAFEVWVE